MTPAALHELRFLASGPLYTGLLNPAALAELHAAGPIEIVEGVIGLDVARVSASTARSTCSEASTNLHPGSTD